MVVTDAENRPGGQAGMERSGRWTPTFPMTTTMTVTAIMTVTVTARADRTPAMARRATVIGAAVKDDPATGDHFGGARP